VNPLLALVIVIVAPIWFVGMCGLIRGIWRNEPLIYVQPPMEIWRRVKREDRATYVKEMRKTFAVQGRDLNRALAKAGRALADEPGKAIGR
jgi:hypothetical protein